MMVFFLKAYLYLGLVLVFVSLASFSPLLIASLQIVSAAAFVLFAIHMKISKPKCRLRFLRPLFLAILVWLLFQKVAFLLNLPFFDIPAPWFRGLDFYGVILIGFTYYTIAQEILSNREELNRFTRFWIILSSMVAVIFIYVFYTSGVRVEKIQIPAFLGPFSPVGFQPNNIVDLFIPGVFFAISLVFYNHRRKLMHSDPSRSIAEIVLYLSFTCVLVAATLFTKSRAGIIAFAIAFGVYFSFFIFSQRRRRGIFKMLAFFLIILVVFLSSLGLRSVFEELTTIQNSVAEEVSSLGTRASGMGAAWELVKTKGGLGVGLENFHMGWLLHHREPFTSFPQVSFNDFLWIWAEMGFVGILFWMILLLTFFFAGLHLAIKSESCFLSFTSIACTASVTALAAHSLVDATFYVPALFILLCILLGVAAACQDLEKTETREGVVVPNQDQPVKIWPAIFLCGLMIFFAGLAACKVYAFVLSQNKNNIEAYEKAVKLDVSNPYYPRHLSYLYFEQYLESKNELDFTKAVQMIDDAIRREPFRVLYYSKRAEMFLRNDDLKGVKKSFEISEEFIPQFYLVKLAACAFYMNHSLELKDRESAMRFQATALRYYSEALELNPSLKKRSELLPFFTADARKIFDELLSEKNI